MRIKEDGILILICISCLFTGCKQKESPPAEPQSVTIKVGHVGHDHHLALFVACDNAGLYETVCGIGLKAVDDQKLYELTKNGQKIADVQIVKVGGGSKMPTALAQNVIDIGFGGVAAMLSAIDSGAPLKIISPLHYKGDMFVVKPDFPAKTWQEFVELAKNAEKPIRIGYKNPVAVAKVIFEEALKHEGITFGGDVTDQSIQIQMINVKGGGKLNVALSGDLIDGYVGNNPFPSIAVDTGAGRIICDLEELPPGNFRNHPCCCIGANMDAIKDKQQAVADLMVLLLMANQTINTNQDKAVTSAIRWIGTSEAVEKMSIPTSGYSMETSQQWFDTMDQWIDAMQQLGVFKGRFQQAYHETIKRAAYNFTLLNRAKKTVEKSG